MSKPKILVVDNDYAFAEFAQLLLESFGYDVLIALSGREALRLAASERPNLILMDLVMPEMDGIETLKTLKSDESIKNIPVMFCSMSKGPKELNEALDCGAIDYIRKPLKREELAQRITKALASGAK